MSERNQDGVCWYLAIILTIIGGLNWGLIGIADINMVEYLYGHHTLSTKAIYISVGVSSVYVAIKVLQRVLKVDQY